MTKKTKAKKKPLKKLESMKRELRVAKKWLEKKGKKYVELKQKQHPAVREARFWKKQTLLWDQCCENTLTSTKTIRYILTEIIKAK